MRRGIHTIRSGWTDKAPPWKPRRYSLDNGDFELNLQLTRLDVFPIGNNHAGNNRDKLDETTVFFVVATNETSAIPTSGTDQPDLYGPTLELRPSDSGQIAWGILSPGGDGLLWSLIDPDHIIPNDVWISAWSINGDGTISYTDYNIGFMMKFEQKKNTGSEALLYQVKEASLR